ncbi:MAG: Histidine kinase [Mucilaginibacter sp.]|nr:Histidine kinase [Mucilaginibacter sp.]
MDAKLPVKRLNSLTWLLAIIASIILSLILSQYPTQKHIFLIAVLTITGISLVGYAHVYIMVILAKRFGLRSKKFSKYRFLFTYPASIAIYLLLWPIFAHLTKEHWSFWDVYLFMAFVGSGVVVNTTVIVLHNSVLLYEHKVYSDLELARLKTANAEAANLLLKQQIHPHFLFNALNTLKALYRKDPAAGDTYIVHLANFLRASIFKHTEKVSRLDEEFKLLQDYLEMQKIRFGTALICTITVPEESFKSYYLPSFSLQPLLENAIKHNELTEETPLEIAIFQQDGRIVVSNNLQKKKMRESSTNNGLANLAERYRLLSEDEILINERNNLFSVSIKLLTHEYSDH